MSESLENEQTPSVAVSPEQQAQPLQVNFFEIMDIAASAVGHTFLSVSKEAAKDLFKTIKKGKPLNLGALNLNQTVKVNLAVTLDYSEFQGPGFNFDVFILSLRLLIRNLSLKIKKGEKIGLLPGANGVQLVAVPAVIESGSQHNVMMLAVEISSKTGVVVQLMYVDPDQFDALKADTTESIA